MKRKFTPTKRLGAAVSALLAALLLGILGSSAIATELPPENTVLPTTSTTTPHTYRDITATAGTWKNGVKSFSYAWNRCNPECAPISGATEWYYTPVAADIGARLSVTVTATNGAGSNSATSEKTSPVAEANTWFQCKPIAEGTGTYEDADCSVEGGSKAYYWKHGGSTVLTSSTGLYRLFWMRPGGIKFEVICTGASGGGQATNSDTAAKLSSVGLTLTGCLLSQPGSQYSCTIPEYKIKFQTLKAESQGLKPELKFEPKTGTWLGSFKLEGCNYAFYNGEYSITGSFNAQVEDPGSTIGTLPSESNMTVTTAGVSMDFDLQGGSSIRTMEGSRALKLDVAP